MIINRFSSASQKTESTRFDSSSLLSARLSTGPSQNRASFDQSVFGFEDSGRATLFNTSMFQQ